MATISRHYTPTACVMPVWFDRIQINPFCSEDKRSVDQMCSKIMDVINDEIASGIPPNRIILGEKKLVLIINSTFFSHI